MREIKFRGFSVSAKRWIYGYVWIVPAVKLFYILTGKIHVKDCSIEKYEVYPESIGEYTGLKDKNGKEIYEGDTYKDHENMLWEVVFRDGCFILENIEIPGGMWIPSYIEIIGNIYENPELLERMDSYKE